MEVEGDKVMVVVMLVVVVVQRIHFEQIYVIPMR